MHRQSFSITSCPFRSKNLCHLNEFRMYWYITWHLHIIASPFNISSSSALRHCLKKNNDVKKRSNSIRTFPEALFFFVLDEQFCITFYCKGVVAHNTKSRARHHAHGHDLHGHPTNTPVLMRTYLRKYLSIATLKQCTDPTIYFCTRLFPPPLQQKSPF